MLSPGTSLGPYRVESALGAGGMGEVYRARDTRLDRTVAIKMLPDSLADDPERRARFEREARTLASVNHPNIAALFGVETIGAATALVMELVPGPTLAEQPPAALADIGTSGGKSQKRSKPLTTQGSSIEISSRPTSSAALTASSRCWTSASQSR